MHPAVDRTPLADLEVEARTLRDDLLAAELAHADAIAACHPTHRESAVNLVHYLELRRHDMRDIQARLGAVGLSSLGRSEPAVLATIEGVLSLLARVNGHEPPEPAATITLSEGRRMLRSNADRLLGTPPANRSPRIMVTLPSEAAQESTLVADMTASGMDVARINCAHDDPTAWARMIDIVRSTRRGDGHRPRVAMDLAGPKVRTGPLQAGPRVIRIAPRRDKLGTVVLPARIWLTNDPESRPEVPSTAVVPVDDASWLERRRPGDRLALLDSRRATRRWTVVERNRDGCLLTAKATVYVASGLKLVAHEGEVDEDEVTIGDLPHVEQSHRVDRGDRVILTRSLEPAVPTSAGTPHRIGCTLTDVFGQVRPGERVWLDDGKFGGTIERVDADEFELVITDVRPGGANLKAGKGINFPDTNLQLDALTEKDLIDLEFIAGHADVVNVSFVRRAGDVNRIQRELERLDAGDVGIVLKIENVAAFEHLPELLLTAMRSRKVGVMIARGDLAVEVGFERLAEVQEEILWVCEAAHVPVVWATQVLDTLARTGQPSRAEVTDAAMSERAECVMLNKGPHIIEAIEALDSILARMQHHQHKKRSLLRRLRADGNNPT